MVNGDRFILIKQFIKARFLIAINDSKLTFSLPVVWATFHTLFNYLLLKNV